MLEERFGVSSMTARRDLELLDESGYARRTHGGAILPELSGHEDSFVSRIETDVSAKTRLAQAVAVTVKPKETIFVDSSSSGFYVVRELLDLAIPLTILTNSLPVMTLVGSGDHQQVELIGTGGSFRKLSQSFVGSETVRMIEHYFVDQVVFSVKGIERGGFLTDPDPLEAEVKRAMVGRARSSLLLAQGQKFSEHGLSVVVPASHVHVAYLAEPPADGVTMFEQAGARVVSV